MDLKDKHTTKNNHLILSLTFALCGIITVFNQEKNMRRHLCSASVAVLSGCFFQLTKTEWLWLFLAIVLVFVTEILNTAIENMVDMITNEQFNLVGKKVKDMAAGAVLLIACFACLVGIFIFLPKIWMMI